MLSMIKCKTPRCIQNIKKYGERYHRVHNIPEGEAGKGRRFWNSLPKSVAYCEACGAYTDGLIWKSECSQCKKEVKAGELVGLFVPHSCKDCMEITREKQRKAGQVCRMCRQVYADCCC
jgi:hypothetical protein